MPPNRRCGQPGRTGKVLQLVNLEAGLHRNWTVMQRDRVPMEEPARHAQGMPGERTAFQINRQNGPARDLAEGAQEADDLPIVEVMQKQRAENKVETPSTKGQGKRVGAHPRPRRKPDVQSIPIERRDDRARETTLNGLTHIAGTGANIQQRERIIGRSELAHQPSCQAMAARPSIDAHQIAQALPRLFLRRVVQILRLNQTRSASAHVAMINAPKPL